ncbi:hypothetical protein [Taklimakanibacter lacteus]|uniref:hypothetical protein n=1 Tax=Taklimakanibacter lacteus TaxID=2268456 RepID=UPI000E672589
MALQTYFVVQPFMETRRGALVALPPVAARDADHARRLIRSQAGAVGAIAFSRRADPEAGDYEAAEVLARWGKVPEGDMEEAA